MSITAMSQRARQTGPGTILRGLVIWLCLTSAAAAQTRPPKAVPVEEETDPGPAPVPQVRKAVPVPDAAPEPAAPKAKPAPEPRSPSVPKSPEDDLFDYCELLYTNASYALALQQYEQYLNIHPAGKHREEAIFKMGECRYLAEAWEASLEVYEQYLREFPNGKSRAVALYHAGEAHYKIASARAAIESQADRIRLAYEAYRAVVQTAKTGPYACYAAFRLGSFSYNAAQKDPDRYKEAVRWFGVAAAQAPKSQPRIRVTSLFYLGRSQRYLKDKKSAAATFTELTNIKEENIYFDQAWQELAQMDMEAGRTEEAMKKFQRLSRDSADAETRAGSLVNAGMIHADAGRTAEAITNFEEALKVPGDKARAARTRARFGLVWSSYKAKAHKEVIDAWRGLQGEDYGDLDEYSRARLWLIVGTSFAALDKHSPAAQTLRLLENLINSGEKAVLEACQEGGYKRIVSLFKLNDPAMVDAVDEYVRVWQERSPEVSWIDKAMLVKGAWYFNRSVWDHSAKAYKVVREAKLDKDKVATWLYQRGCAEASSGDKDAVSTLTSFLAGNVDDERAPMAQLQRALVRLKLDDLTNALSDFDEVAKKTAGTENGETAAYNAARVRGMKQDFAGMAAGFSKFLADYPKTRAAAEANYWIGTASYQLQKYAECLAPLRTARSLDSKSYYQDGSLMIIAALAALQDIEALIPEVDAYLKVNMDKRISPDILRWLGMTLFRERKDYAKAARYLGFVVSFQDPDKTPTDIWGAHGECLLEIKDYAGAIIALDNHLKSELRPQPRARAFLLRGRAQFGAGKLEEAAKSVEEGLNIERENLIAAQLHMLSGDISMASNRHKEAIGSYNVVRSTWEDPTLTPAAISKMIACLSKSKEPKDLEDAEKLKNDLVELFPKYQAPK